MAMSSEIVVTATTRPNVIDSHLHVWGTIDDSKSGSYPFVQDPVSTLQNIANVDTLIQYMEQSHIDGALIVQPINYQYDHSYVRQAIKQYPSKFKGMMLYDPTISDAEHAIQTVDDLVSDGFVGIRFNPYLWKQINETTWEPMSQGISLHIYKYCSTKQIPVGIMCFRGLSLHYHDIVQLIRQSPETILILDHFAFTKIPKPDENSDDNDFHLLLQLAQHENVHVKISALFRLQDTDTSTYSNIYKQRFQPLVEAYGSQRLLYGSDFPYIIEHDTKAYDHAYQLVASWCQDHDSRNNIMGATAERLFGRWG